MKINKDFYISIGAILLIGAFISLLMFIRIDSWMTAVLIGYFYSIILVVSLQLVRRSVIRKLSVFSTAQQWLIRSLVYLVAISFAYLLGLIFQTLILTPFSQIQDAILDRFWSTFVNLVTLPFNLEFTKLLPEFEQPLMVTFFTVLIFISIVSLLGSFVEMRWRENKQRQLRDRAELLALKSQIEPHFLFNSLNTIASLIPVDAGKSEKLIIQLSEILQYMSLNAKKECIALEDEISFSKKYCNLMLARFDRLLEINWEEDLKNNRYQVPVLIIQPHIENCVRHGWGDQQKSLMIKISLREAGKDLIIQVSDNGKGIPDRILNRLPNPDHALANIADRLNLMYKKQNLLSLEAEENKGTTVSITIPEDCHA